MAGPDLFVITKFDTKVSLNFLSVPSSNFYLVSLPVTDTLLPPHHLVMIRRQEEGCKKTQQLVIIECGDFFRKTFLTSIINLLGKKISKKLGPYLLHSGIEISSNFIFT